MPAASYREGPDGHSSRKQNSKKGEQNARLLLSRGALSAMAIFRRAAFPSVRRWRCTAPYPLLASAAPALCLSCF